MRTTFAFAPVPQEQRYFHPGTPIRRDEGKLTLSRGSAFLRRVDLARLQPLYFRAQGVDFFQEPGDNLDTGGVQAKIVGEAAQEAQARDRGFVVEADRPLDAR